MAEDELHSSPAETREASTPDVAQSSAVETPSASQTSAQDLAVANYHIALWTEPRSYYCIPCALSGFTEAEVQAHVQSVHSEVPVPTPLAQQPDTVLPPDVESADA
jgi:hypothetical protein